MNIKSRYQNLNMKDKKKPRRWKKNITYQQDQKKQGGGVMSETNLFKELFILFMF